MHLKRVEMSGFKSFADRTVIEFKPGLTAIVGPNGSGKSNVTEAIRWVLGEQSAKNLRGDKMYDVIFGGSNKRHAMNTCEVTIVLDNTDRSLAIDNDEVNVTRRLNRKGESYYAINKKQCRLKDIVELFMDSGLGKHSFSIISQGKVEAIFDDKPESRRALFEEAAGVLKYKQRKNEALQKLNETDDNLDRLADIIYEIEQQKGPLEEQVGKAKIYQELTKRKRELDVNVTVSRIIDLKQNYEQLQVKIPRMQQQYDVHNNEMTNLNDYLQELTNSLINLEQDLEQSYHEQLTLTEQFEQKQALQQINLERQQHNTKTKADLNQAIFEEEASLTEIVAQIALEAEKKHDLENKINQIQVKLNKIIQKINDLAIEKQLSVEDLQTNYFELMQEQANTRNEEQNLEKQYAKEASKQQRQDNQNEELQQKYEVTKHEVSRLKEEQQKLQSKQQNQRNKLQLAETKLEHEQNLLKNQQERLQQAQIVISQVQAKKQSLEAMQKNYNGFYQGVRAVLKAKIPGVIGAVANVLHMQVEYTKAIEVAIGSAMQNIIVEDEIAASKAINYLKVQKQGRATFLPKSIIKAKTLPKELEQQLQNEVGFIGIGLTLVNFDKEVANVIASLLGQTIVMDNLANANKISKKLNYKYKVVTLDGEIIRPGGAMTGGAGKQNQTLLTQQVELQELNVRLPQMQQEIMRLETKIKEQESLISVLVIEKQESQEELQELTIKGHNLEKELLVKEQIIERLEKEYHLIANLNSETANFLNNYQTKKQELTDKLQYLTKAIADVKQEIDLATKSKEERQQQQAELMADRKELVAKIEGEKAILVGIDSNLHRLEVEKKAKEQKIMKWEAQIQAMGKAISQEELQALEQELKEIETKKDKIEQQIIALKTTITEKEQEKTAQTAKKEELLKLVSELQSEIQTQKLQFEQIDNKLDEDLEYLSSEYQLTFELAKQQAKILSDYDAALVELRDLKQQIKTLGPVNLDSLAQYQELSERYSFMINQRDDLIAAKDQLLFTMAEMDQQVKEKFKTTFDAIAAAFKELFPKIFGGGSASLTLTDPDDLLNTGIEISAMPPGKKLQRLSLLSGGERSLTAITLLFAMIQVKPVPFCILDEVEAALDEANVYRFGKYLRQLDNKTQFIVITHRKGTMEAAETLYGVTMQESGISKLVSVRMENVAEAIELNAK